MLEERRNEEIDTVLLLLGAGYVMSYVAVIAGLVF